jgi:hypothetical protein
MKGAQNPIHINLPDIGFINNVLEEAEGLIKIVITNQNIVKKRRRN